MMANPIPSLTKVPPAPPNKEDADVSYVYMPRLQRIPEPVILEKTTQSQVPEPATPAAASWHKRKILYLGLGGGLLLLLLALGLFLLIRQQKEQPPPTPLAPMTKLPKVWLNQYFNLEVCDQPTVCSDEADPDDDGLDNYNEFKQGTKPKTADSDEDGLADGDEINIYKTEPDLKYTDRREVAALNDYNDGNSVKNGYDPLTPGLKFTETRRKQIAEDTAKYGLHEPSITTLKEPEEPASQAKTYTVFIEGNKFQPEIAKINVGDTVVWLNKDLMKHQIASNPHPQHSDLPELISPDLTNSQTYSFKFEQPGKFGYHDHLNSSIVGSIEVSEVNASASP